MAVSPCSSPAAPSTTEPVQTDVVNRVPAWARRTQSSTRASCSNGRVPTPPGKTTTSGAATSSKVASTLSPIMPFSLRTSPAVVADEDDVEGRDALQDLVGPDGVERGELREEGDGDLQAVGHADVLSSGARHESAAGRHRVARRGASGRRGAGTRRCRARIAPPPRRACRSSPRGRGGRPPARVRSTKRLGVSPTSAVKTRVKCRTLMAAAAASAGSRWSPPGAASTRVCTARMVERSARGDPHRRRELGLAARAGGGT